MRRWLWGLLFGGGIRPIHWRRLWYSATELWQTDPSEWWFFWLVSFEDRVVAACASTDALAVSRRVWLYGGFHNMWEARRWWREHFTEARPQTEVDRVRGYVFGARKRVRAQHT